MYGKTRRKSFSGNLQLGKHRDALLRLRISTPGPVGVIRARAQWYRPTSMARQSELEICNFYVEVFAYRLRDIQRR